MSAVQQPTIQDPGWLRRHLQHDALIWGFFAGTLMLMLILSFAISPEDLDSGKVWLTPTCPSKRFLGIECPTCGMSRGFAALSRGRVREAMDFNRGAPIVYVLTWVGIVWSSIKAGRSIREVRRMGRKGEGS